MNILNPILSKANIKPIATFLIGTVRGDLHDVGKNLVAMMFEGAGFKVVDLGIDVPEERFIEAIREHKPDIVGLSALLTMTLPMMQSTINAMSQSCLRDSFKIMVGGAPVTDRFAREIGADGYAPDSASAVEKARDFLKV